ncbi:pro-neuregulin-1, membrane-bound isoform-like isoform X4 [Acipenser ruthenus]|uniref:pro-neuregulin-1, membrane-bound isoform-like isoform X4 n=1 Tax=Acipenser ruthenus TaxID=7906 RepID=UPI0027404776|nr:pro-neuregulin-1, membrane-bound isoform-like isoform X4 [Acipenser ruthenus]
MSEGADETSPGPPTPPCAAAAAADSPLFASTAQENAPEVSAATEGVAEENRALGLAGMAATCCICMETAQVRSCLNSEKICILPILACLISLALCTAGLKWVFVDKIFEPHTHLDPNRIGQDPVIYADQTLGPTGEPPAVHTSVLPSHSTGQQTVQVKGDPSVAPDPVHNPTFNSPTSALTLLTTPATQRPLTTTNVKGPTTGHPLQTVETNIIKIPKLSTTTVPTIGTGHVIKCSDSEKNYCVNGGECFILNTIPSKTKYLCRCPNEFTGDRCQNYVMASFYKHLGIEFMEAEELYQKRVLTITGICIALLVVGIMCVVAYCKTKKQRKKLHDRLRQSLRSERNNMNNLANGPYHPNPPTESVQLVNQHASKNAISADHIIEKETETSFSTSQYSSTTRHDTPVTQTSSHSWNNGKTESMTSESRSALVTSSMGTNGQTSPVGHRGRLNGTGCARDLTTYLKNARDSPESYKDSPHSERYVSAMTTPTRMSPVELQSPLSPPSEMSPPLSSLATSVPSMAISPLVEDERPLLLVTPPRVREKRNDHTNSNQQRNSAHYNHGHEAHSPPPSPLRIVEDDEYETTQEYEPAVQQPAKKVANGRRAKRTKLNGHIPHKLESDSDSSSESSSSESETEDERIGEDTPFLSIQNPMAANLESAPAFRLADGSRTNTTHQLSTQEDLQARLSSVIVNQDPIAV